MMQGLRVTFNLCSPMVQESEHPIHLDGLLAWCISEQAQRKGVPDPWAASEDLSGCLAGQVCAGEWVWKASMLHLEAGSERFFMNQVRKCEPEAFLQGYENEMIEGRQRSYINSGSGQLKAYQMMVPYRWIKSATAFCVGELMPLRAALGELKHLGKQGRNGFGRIASCEVEPDDEANKLWMLRAMPIDAPVLHDKPTADVLYPLRPPYWKKTARVMAKLPVL